MKRIIPLLLCGLILLGGCAGESESPLVTEDAPKITLITPDGDLGTIPEATLPPETLPEVTTTSPGELVYTVQTYDYGTPEEDFSGLLIEFESGNLAGGFIADDREDYSGSGYVTLDSRTVAVEVTVNIPLPQHYNITVRAASERPASGTFRCDGVFSDKELTLAGTGDYETVRYDNIYFTEGAHSFVFGTFSDTVDLDCIYFEISESMTALDYRVSGGISNENASDSARALYKYIAENYGKAVLSGQQCTQGSNAELEAIYSATGRYPAIRFSDLSGYSSGDDTGDAELMLEWANSGGIVGYSWYWAISGSLELFDLTAAVTDLDIASMDGGALAQRFQNGDITAETLLVIDGIDLIAAQLKKLQAEDVPVLFRPMPEAGNGVFWWGKDAESYLWLYKLLYERLDFYHGLDNIIWVWNGQSVEFYPGDDMCDIISLDLYYPDGIDPTQSGINFMLAAREISEEKPIALSECGALPTPDNLSMDKCLWSYVSVWSGGYAMTDSEISEKYISKSAWQIFYSCDMVITKDEIEYDR